MKHTWRSLVALLAVSIVAGPALAKEKRQVIERYEANAMSLQAGRASRMDIGIFGFNTEEQRAAMISTFDQGGNDALYKLLGKQDEMAFVSLPGTLGYQMRYVYQFESGGKRMITMATDRPIAMGEIRRGSSSQDYNISLVVLELDPTTGEGTGEMIVGAEFGFNKKTGRFQIETAGQDPIKFTTVKPVKVKNKK